MTDRLPNIIDLGRRPEEVRYTWILQTTLNYHMGAAWVGLQKAMAGKEIVSFYVVDLRKGKAYKADPHKWLESWRPHYFDANWDFKGEKA